MKTFDLIFGLISGAWGLVFKLALIVIAIVYVVGFIKTFTANATLDERSSCQQFQQAAAATQDKVFQDMMNAHNDHGSLSLTRTSVTLYCDFHASSSPIDAVFMLDANSSFCGNCGKRFGGTAENSPTPPIREYQPRLSDPGFSNPGIYDPSQPGYASSPLQPGYVSSSSQPNYTPPPPKRSRTNRIYLVVIAILVFMLIGTFIFFLGRGSGQGSTGTALNAPTQAATNAANNNATSTVASASPTALTATPTDGTVTPDFTATTASLPLASAETLSENIRLTCDCTDPVVVTITQITVQPLQNRMIWSLTFFNNTQINTGAQFDQFSLQKGDQINYPTQGEQTFDATGGGIDTGVSLQAGETKQVTLTFSFVPYKSIPYTLSSQLAAFSSVTFNPVVIQF
jgi:hypothetical protein